MPDLSLGSLTSFAGLAAAGALIPLVLWAVWSATRRIHQSVVELSKQT